MSQDAGGSGANPGPVAEPALGSVLIVEDEVIQAELLASTLRDAGAGEIRRCTTAAEALAELKTFTPAILILDVHLADNHDGWLMAELAQQIFPKMPMVVFATASPERIPRAISALGMLAIKPYDAAELVEEIRARLVSTRPTGWRALLARTKD